MPSAKADRKVLEQSLHVPTFCDLHVVIVYFLFKST